MTTPMPPDARPASQEKEAESAESARMRSVSYMRETFDLRAEIAALKAQLTAMEAELAKEREKHDEEAYNDMMAAKGYWEARARAAETRAEARHERCR